MGGTARSILQLSSGVKDRIVAKDLRTQLTHAFDSNTRIFHRVFYRSKMYSIGVQRNTEQGFLAADFGTHRIFDGRAYYQWNKHVDAKVQCMSVVGKGWDHHIRGRLNYRDVGFSCTAELEKPKGKGVACTLSYVQALTHKYQCGAQMKFDYPLNTLKYALGLRAAHPNGTLSATLNNGGLLQLFFHRHVAHYQSPYISNLSIATGLKVRTLAEKGPEAKASIGWCMNLKRTGAQLRACIDDDGKIKTMFREQVARGVVASIFANVSHWTEIQAAGAGPRYEFGIFVRVGPESLQEPAFSRFSAV